MNLRSPGRERLADLRAHDGRLSVLRSAGKRPRNACATSAARCDSSWFIASRCFRRTLDVLLSSVEDVCALLPSRMKTLIVHAHPEPGSFTGAMKQVAVETLRRAGHEVRVSDLYEMRFNPVASSADFQARTNNAYLLYSLEQAHADRTNTVAEDIAAEIE